MEEVNIENKTVRTFCRQTKKKAKKLFVPFWRVKAIMEIMLFPGFFFSFLQSNFYITQNRLANLDKDNNPASCTATSNGGGVCYANNHPLTDCSSQINLNENSSASTKVEGDIIESPVYSFSTMTTPSHENLLLGNVGSCDPLFGVQCDEQIDSGMR